MNCPRCAKTTRKQTVKSVRLDRCPSCDGTWYDAGELRVLKDRASSGDYRWIDLDLWRDRGRFRAGRQESLLCPKDKTTMTTVRYGTSRVRIDTCGRCRGIWLDKTEYEKVLKYLDKRVDTETVEGYLEDLKEEFLEIFTGPEGFRSEIADFLKVLHLLELRFIVQHPRIATTVRTASRGVPGA